MRFGLILPSFSFPDLDYARAARLRDFAVRAEALGYEALWVVEHLLTARGLYGTAWLSPLETLGFAPAAPAVSSWPPASGIFARLKPRNAHSICRPGESRDPPIQATE